MVVASVAARLAARGSPRVFSSDLVDELDLKPILATYRGGVTRGFPPRYLISAVVRLLKAVSAKEIRDEFSEVRKQLWGGEFWEDGYFVRTVGDKVTADVIRKYIRFHEAKKREIEQLDLF